MKVLNVMITFLFLISGNAFSGDAVQLDTKAKKAKKELGKEIQKKLKKMSKKQRDELIDMVNKDVEPKDMVEWKNGKLVAVEGDTSKGNAGDKAFDKIRSHLADKLAEKTRKESSSSTALGEGSKSNCKWKLSASRNISKDITPESVAKAINAVKF